MRKAGASIRWCPHAKMVADSLAQDDYMRTSGALPDLLRTGTLSLVDETEELARRASAEGRTLKRRSNGASVERFRQECQSRGGAQQAVGHRP
eukprot:12867018-Alexandrium_andersonii.AAC.1